MKTIKALIEWPIDYAIYVHRFCYAHPVQQWPAVFASAYRVSNMLFLARQILH